MAWLANGVFIALVAHGLIGVSLVWDKVLLERPETKSVPNYVFWLGAMSIFGLALIPFGFHRPPPRMAALGFGAGFVHLAAIWFYYRALRDGEASQALAVMGGFSPLATALIGAGLLERPLGGASEWGFGLMVAGGFLMFLSEKLNWRRLLPSVLFSSALFGLTNVLEKIVFDATGFVTGYVFFTLGTFAGAMMMLLGPAWRKEIFEHSGQAPPKSKLWYFVNRFLSGAGSFLAFFAISRASPAIVDAISGVRYVIIFAASYVLTRLKPVWLRENFERRALVCKLAATGLIAAGLVLIGAAGQP